MVVSVGAVMHETRVLWLSCPDQQGPNFGDFINSSKTRATTHGLGAIWSSKGRVLLG